MSKMSNIYSFSGNLHLSLERALSDWKNLFREKHGELNFSSCHLNEIPPQQLISELSTPPFLAEKRLTFVYIDLDIPKSHADYLDDVYWGNLLKSVPNDHIVAFIQAENLPSLD